MNYSLIEDNKGIISFMLFLQVKQTLHTPKALGSFEEIINRYEVIFGPYLVRLQENMDQKKQRIWALFAQRNINIASIILQ